MEEKKFNWSDIFFGAFLLAVMLRVMLGIFSPSSVSVSRNVSGGYFSKLAELLMKVTPYFLVVAMVVMFILSVYETWTEWKDGNMTKKGSNNDSVTVGSTWHCDILYLYSYLEHG